MAVSSERSHSLGRQAGCVEGSEPPEFRNRTAAMMARTTARTGADGGGQLQRLAECLAGRAEHRRSEVVGDRRPRVKDPRSESAVRLRRVYRAVI